MSVSEPAKTDSLVGQLIDGRYRISREIAVGGMGVVYEAKHAKIGRSVAIKVLHREMAGDSEVVSRFLNEARAMGTIGHPNIVACTDFGELPGHLPYLVLEYLEGKTLGEAVATSGPFPVVRALRVAAQVASALDAAHARGVIHRDLTSGNVFLTKTEGDLDQAKVLDFGISKFLTATEASPKTRRGFTMGTPEFMAPEQITHPDVVDARCDVYALGVIIYHMLAGKTPFGGVAVQTLFLQVVNELPPHIERTDIPPEVLALLDKALSKNPADRYANMKEMGQELELLAPAPVQSGVFAGRVDSPGTGRVGTGPVALRSNTLAGKSGLYPNGSRTSLVDMASKATTGEQARSKSPAKLIVGVLGLAAVAAAGWFFFAGPGRRATSPAGGPVAAPSAPAPSAMPSAPVLFQVFSSAPSARVTFRGRAHQIPFAETVSSDSKLELVEVTAPAREGRRFWLTMDHPMKLTVDLTPGRGVIEATTEEAQIALGERTADPATAAPSHQTATETKPSAPSAPAASSSSSSSSHRSSSRGKVAVAAVSSSAKGAKGGNSTSGSGPSAPPTIEPPTPAPAPAPPVKASAPAPEPAVTAPPPAHAAAPEPPPPPPAAPPAKVAPTRPAPAPVAAAPAAPRGPVVGTIDSARAQQVFAEHQIEIQRCHQRAKIDNSDIRGKLNLKIAISPSGQVTATNIETSNLHNGSLEACIVGAVKSWTFPAPTGGPATLTHLFVLR